MRVSDQLGFSVMEQAKQAFENLINVKLDVCYDSTEDDNEDETLGHFITTFIEPEPFKDATDHNVCVNIYQDGSIQFFFDATPFPTKTNTAKEAKNMMVSLCPHPTPFEKVTVEDYKAFIDNVKELLEDYE